MLHNSTWERISLLHLHSGGRAASPQDMSKHSANILSRVFTAESHKIGSECLLMLFINYASSVRRFVKLCNVRRLLIHYSAPSKKLTC